jgi:heme/copper-type cytochrome/quinol oxidase subunit 4
MKNFIKVAIIQILLILAAFLVSNDKKETLIQFGVMISWGILCIPIGLFLEKKSK